MIQELSPEVENYVYRIYKKYESKGIRRIEDLVNKINDRGTFVDLDNSSINQLSDTEIAALRYIFDDKRGVFIARKRILDESLSRKFLLEYRKQTVDLPKKTETTSSKKSKYVLTKEQKYNNKRHKINKKPKINFGKVLIAGSLVITLIWGGNELLFEKEVVETQLPQFGTEKILDDKEYSIDYEKDMDELVEQSVIIGERKATIRKICDIYQVNYDVVYEKLVELTDNFSSEEFLAGTMNWVTCKGETINTTSEEELYVYAIRKIKQDPASLNVSTSNLHINNDYRSNSNFAEQIEWAANIVGVDKNLIYAISYSETCFSSDLFNYNNNPAGIRDGSDWWSFDTKEEGFLELCMEVSKYYRLIGEEDKMKVNDEIIAKIGAIHCPTDDPTDVYGLNSNWVINVIDRYQYALSNQTEIFGTVSQNNGLSH